MEEEYAVIEIDSPKYGHYEVIIDKEDFGRCSKLQWNIRPYKRNIKNWYTSNYKVGLLHRFLVSAPKGMQVDHINRDTLNNRKDNLRICSNKENTRNTTPIRDNNTSGHKGVMWDKRTEKWMSYIMVNYKFKNLGYYNDFDEAVEVREQAERSYFGEYSALVQEEKLLNSQINV